LSPLGRVKKREFASEVGVERSGTSRSKNERIKIKITRSVSVGWGNTKKRLSRAAGKGKSGV
jgi:hypothetical protein